MDDSDSNLSLLDLLFCAFGGVLVLAVIFAALIGQRTRQAREPFLWVQARADSANPAPNAVLRLRLCSLAEVDSCVLNFRDSGIEDPGGSCTDPRVGQSRFSITSFDAQPPEPDPGNARRRAHASLLLDGISPGPYRVEVRADSLSQEDVTGSVCYQYPSRTARGSDCEDFVSGSSVTPETCDQADAGVLLSSFDFDIDI